MASVELVGAGAALTGGAMLLEEATKPKVAPGHDNVYATDKRPLSLNMKPSQVRRRPYLLQK